MLFEIFCQVEGEVEGANWLGPVRLSVHLPFPPPHKNFFFRFGFFVKMGGFGRVVRWH